MKIIHAYELQGLCVCLTVRAEIEDQVSSARTLAEALMQLFLCVNGLVRILPNTCRYVTEMFSCEVQSGFLRNFRKLSLILKKLWPCIN